MVVQIKRTRLARQDIEEIWTYVAERNLRAADEFIDELKRVCGLLAAQPGMGRERREISPGIRSFAVMSWIVFYRVHDEFIEIVRVIHGARDLDQIDF